MAEKDHPGLSDSDVEFQKKWRAGDPELKKKLRKQAETDPEVENMLRESSEGRYREHR